MKVIFLDFDGVLNLDDHLIRTELATGLEDHHVEEAVRRLNDR